MLDLMLPWGAEVPPYRSPCVVTEVASEPWQVHGYWALRKRVFVDEQAIFEQSDHDDHDLVAKPIVACCTAGGMRDQVVGVVRIYPCSREAGTWYGGRLGVCPDYRTHGGVGAGLIDTAVGIARAEQCTRFLATVQRANVRYFERRHFAVLGSLDLMGRPHALMEAELSAFTPIRSASMNGVA